VLFKENK